MQGDIAARLPAAAAAEHENVASRIFGAHDRTIEAHAILDSRVAEMNTGAAYGARSLVKVAVDATSAADATNTRNDCEHASCASPDLPTALRRRCTIFSARPTSGTRRSTASSKRAFVVASFGTVHYQPSFSSVMCSGRMAGISTPRAQVHR